MKLARSFVAIALGFTLVFVSSLTLTMQSVSAQDTKIALQRGYRTGYSDGYMSGYRDAIENAKLKVMRDMGNIEPRTARTTRITEASLTNYKDGYQQGFEKGYDTGYGKQEF